MDITKIKNGITNCKLTTWPGSDQDIYLRILSEMDSLRAEQYCDGAYRERSLSLGNIDERNALKDSYCLYLAIVDGDGRRVFDDFDVFCSCISSEIRKSLIDQQNSFQAECSPKIAEMSDKEVDALIEDIKKNSQIVLNISDMYVLRRLIITLAGRLQRLPKRN
jgi:hypothetical protein